MVEVAKPGERFKEILRGDQAWREVEGFTMTYLLFGFGSLPFILLGLMPYSLLDVRQVVWALPTIFAKDLPVKVQRECIRFGRQCLSMLPLILFAEIDPTNSSNLAFARAFGFRPVGRAGDRLLMRRD